MLGLKKRAIKGKKESKTASFHQFGIGKKGAGVLQVFDTLNCSCRDGKLRGGVGLKPYEDAYGNRTTILMLAGDFAGAHLATSKNGSTESKQVYIVGKDGYLYLRNPQSMQGIKKLFVGPSVDHLAMRMETGEIRNLFSGTADVAMTTDGTSFSNRLWDGMRGSCILKGRYILARYNGEIRYSAVFSPFEESSSDPDGSGTIYLPASYGEVVGMKEYGGEAYIFCEKGIFRLTVSAKASDFTLKNVPYKGGSICLRSMAISEKGIVFLASEGAYCVNGDFVKRICEHLPIGPCDHNQLCATAYGTGFFIIEYTQKKPAAAEKKRLVIDTDCEDAFFTDFYGTLGGNEYTLMSSLLCVFTKDETSVKRSQLPYYTSVPLDFGTRKTKRLKRLRLKGSGEVIVIMRCGAAAHSYVAIFQNGEAEIPLWNKGKTVMFTFQMKPWSYLEGMEVDYTVEE